MYLALYRKYRPQKFSDVVGQDVIIKTLENSILNDRINHAYLFTGPRGTGKTTVAKIFAKVVNCFSLNGLDTCEKCESCIQYNNKQNVDIIEIDAASNNGVDEIRELREKINLVPNISKYKVYIIDEVHMLTTSAFNALLKTLEEPPKHIIFILATTEPHKVPLTILSRCQRFDFGKISDNKIIERIKYICSCEKVRLDDKVIKLVAKFSDGCMRDALSLLDKVLNYKSEGVTPDDLYNIYGSIDETELSELIEEISNKNIKIVFEKIDKYYEKGKNFIKIMELLIDFYKNMLIFDIKSDLFDKDIREKYEKLCKKIKTEEIYKNIEILLEMIKISKTTSDYKLIFEISVIKMIKNNYESEKKSSENIEKNLKTENFVEKKEENELKNNDEILKIRKIRINNALSRFNKKELLEFKKNFEKINKENISENLISCLSLIQDGELKVKGDNYLIYVYETKNLEEYFNMSLKNVEIVLYELLKIKYKPIAISYEEWQIIKENYNKAIKENKNSYIFIEENDNLDMLEEKNNIKNTSLDEEFNDIIEYE